MAPGTGEVADKLTDCGQGELVMEFGKVNRRNVAEGNWCSNMVGNSASNCEQNFRKMGEGKGQMIPYRFEQ